MSKKKLKTQTTKVQILSFPYIRFNMDESVMSSRLTTAIILGVVGSLISMIVIILLSIDLVCRHRSAQKTTELRLNSRILSWQLLAFLFHFLTCLCYSFFRTNLLWGGIDNEANYDPTSSDPYSFTVMIVTYIAGKVCTDISWIIRTYATFQVYFTLLLNILLYQSSHVHKKFTPI